MNSDVIQNIVNLVSLIGILGIILQYMKNESVNEIAGESKHELMYCLANIFGTIVGISLVLIFTEELYILRDSVLLQPNMLYFICGVIIVLLLLIIFIVDCITKKLYSEYITNLTRDDIQGLYEKYKKLQDSSDEKTKLIFTFSSALVGFFLGFLDILMLLNYMNADNISYKIILVLMTIFIHVCVYSIICMFAKLQNLSERNIKIIILTGEIKEIFINKDDDNYKNSNLISIRGIILKNGIDFKTLLVLEKGIITVNNNSILCIYSWNRLDEF